MTLQDGENVAPSGCSTESRTAENETQSRWQNSRSRVVRPRLQPSRTDSLTYNPWKRWDASRQGSSPAIPEHWPQRLFTTGEQADRPTGAA